jgi:hypothetical protein
MMSLVGMPMDTETLSSHQDTVELQEQDGTEEVALGKIRGFQLAITQIKLCTEPTIMEHTILSFRTIKV